MREFAQARGLELAEEPRLRPLTPALLPGPRGGIAALAQGQLAAGLAGTLCHHVFRDGADRRDATVLVTEVPQTIAFAPAIVCRDRAGMGRAALAQLPGDRWQPVELESQEFNDRYRLFALAGQDELWLRELFSPALISWLAAEVPPGFGFELNEGHLAVMLPGHEEDPAALERLCADAAELARRLRVEAEEEGRADPDLFTEREEQEALAAALPLVDWPQPPASVGAAVDAYRKRAARRPRVVAGALLWGLAGGAAAAGPALLALGSFAAALAGLAAAAVAFAVARLVRSARYRFGRVAVAHVGLEAFVREYARSRGLELEDRWRFHAEMRHLPMPGVADHVLAGELSGGVEGRFVMFGNAAEMRSRGEEIAHTAERPLAANALLVRLPEAAPTDLAERLAPLPDHYRAEAAGRDLLVWRPIPGNLIRTAEGCDGFCAKAGAVAARALELATMTG